MYPVVTARILCRCPFVDLHIHLRIISNLTMNDTDENTSAKI